MTRSGAPSALNTRLLAIAPSSQPSCAAAAAAVGALSGSSLTSPATPRSRSTAANLEKSTGMWCRLAGASRPRRTTITIETAKPVLRSATSAAVPGRLQLPLGAGRLPHPASAQLGQHSLAEPVRLLQVRVAGQDELRDAQRPVLLDQVGHLGVAADQRGAGAAAHQPDPGPQVRVDLQVPGDAAVPVRRVQRVHPVLAG